MNITVLIKCNDGETEMCYKMLNDWRYFNDMFSNFNTKVTKELVSIDHKPHFVYKIPIITLPCKLITLHRIFEVHIFNITSDEYNEDLIDYLYFNGLTGRIGNIETDNYSDISDLLLYVKEKLPQVNAYNFVYEGGLSIAIYNTLTFHFELLNSNQLNPLLLSDFLQYTSIYYFPPDSYSTHNNNYTFKNLGRFIEYLDFLCHNDELELVKSINPTILFRDDVAGYQQLINEYLNKYSFNNMHWAVADLFNKNNINDY